MIKVLKDTLHENNLKPLAPLKSIKNASTSRLLQILVSLLYVKYFLPTFSHYFN